MVDSLLNSVLIIEPAMEKQNRIWKLMGRKLAGNISSEELQELESLMEKNPDHHFLLDLLLEKKETTASSNSEVSEKYFQRHMQRLQLHQAVKKPLLSKPYQYMTALIVIIFGAWLIISTTENKNATAGIENSSEVVYASNGERIQQTLPDGSTVWLNGGTKLQISFSKGIRKVEMQGEGFFDVKKDSSRPFIIQTANMEITVTGTRLNVKAYPDDPTEETALINGSVTIKERITGKDFLLVPNEKLVLTKKEGERQGSNKDGMVISEKILLNKSNINFSPVDSTILETSWVNNRLAFEDESLESLALMFSRWYGIHIVVDKNELKSKQAMEALKITGGFNYYKTGDTIKIF